MKWPVTPEVAGSSPVAPVEIPCKSTFLLSVLAQTTAGFPPARSPPGNRLRADEKVLQTGMFYRRPGRWKRHRSSAIPRRSRARMTLSGMTILVVDAAGLRAVVERAVVAAARGAAPDPKDRVRGDRLSRSDVGGAMAKEPLERAVAHYTDGQTGRGPPVQELGDPHSQVGPKRGRLRWCRCRLRSSRQCFLSVQWQRPVRPVKPRPRAARARHDQRKRRDHK
jgi:hypothetical protein